MVMPFFSFAADVPLSSIFGTSNDKVKGWTLEDIEWDEVYDDGSKLAILEGPRDQPGKDFTYAFFLPDGIWVPAHWHCASASVFVPKGTMLLGMGDKIDKNNVVEYPTGSYVIFPYRSPHFEAAKGDLLIIGTGRGPWCHIDTE